MLAFDFHIQNGSNTQRCSFFGYAKQFNVVDTYANQILTSPDPSCHGTLRIFIYCKDSPVTTSEMHGATFLRHIDNINRQRLVKDSYRIVGVVAMTSRIRRLRILFCDYAHLLSEA